jgi:urease accessory protein
MTVLPRRAFLRRLVALAALLAAPLAQAHPGHNLPGLAGGLLHPLTGIDHLLAALAVGFWAAQLGGRARWLVPSAFVGMLGLGAVFGHAVGAVSGTEQAIAASLVVLGLLIALAARLPALAGMALVGAFALFHGMAHGAEMPATASGLAYGIGFAATTAALLAAGVVLGVFAVRLPSSAPRIAGWAVAAAGIVLIAR